MRRLAISTLSIAGLTAGMISLSAPAVMAESTCQKETGGSTSSVAYTGKNSGRSTDGYTCAYQADKGKSSLSPWATKSWTSNTPEGYYRMKDCTDKDSSSISLSPAYAQTDFGSSWTQTATNWDATKTHHWGPGIFWATDDVQSNQWTSSDCNWGDFPTNMFWQTSLTISLDTYDKLDGTPTFTVTVTPDANAPAQGEAGVFIQAGDAPDPTSDQVIAGGTLDNGSVTAKGKPLESGEYTFYAAYGGSGAGEDPPVQPYELTPPQRGWLPGESSSITQTIQRDLSAAASISAVTATSDVYGMEVGGRLPMSVVNESTEYPKMPQATCEAGEVPIHVEGYSPKKTIGHEHVRWSDNGAKLKVKGMKDGSSLGLQLVCRPTAEKPTSLGELRLGTVRADTLKQKKSGPVYAGPGRDEVTIKAKKSSTFGALGRDRLILKAANAAADGGPGADKIKSNTKPKKADGKRSGRALLIGGPGPDTLISGKGPDRINARDGKPDDKVECRGSKTRVLADKGDKVTGNCKNVKRK
ncbi:MAG: hypothetical protein GY813_17280 [Halieaceae bacterium]|nr:hypothetical protein [Halieaceae bacterium]